MLVLCVLVHVCVPNCSSWRRQFVALVVSSKCKWDDGRPPQFGGLTRLAHALNQFAAARASCTTTGQRDCRGGLAVHFGQTRPRNWSEIPRRAGSGATHGRRQVQTICALRRILFGKG